MSQGVDPNAVTSLILRFGKTLRDNNFKVSVPGLMDAARAVELIGIENAQDVRSALRCALVNDETERFSFDRLFEEFWLQWPIDEKCVQDTKCELSAPGESKSSTSQDELFISELNGASSQEEYLKQSEAHVVHSSREILRATDFKEIPIGSDKRMERFITEIVESLTRRIKRKQRFSMFGNRFDFRRLLRRNAKYGGEILEIPLLKQKKKIRRLVFLCDVSGSMNPYLNFTLRFIRELSALPSKVETFVFATRLTRITDLLKAPTFHGAMDAVAKQVEDWSGGTRIGHALKTFSESWSSELLRPSTVLIIHSDGWDRGDPEELKKIMGRLSAKAHRILWINPLLGSRGYEPICRGMSAALPFVDSFLSGRNMDSLEKVAHEIAALY